MGPNTCSANNITLWNNTANLTNVSIVNGEVGPAQFQVGQAGTYLVGYHLDISDQDDAPLSLTNLFFECQSSGFAIEGSRSSITVDTQNIHISNKFLAPLLQGDQIGLFAANDLQNDLCINVNKATFWLKRLGPLVIA